MKLFPYAVMLALLALAAGALAAGCQGPSATPAPAKAPAAAPDAKAGVYTCPMHPEVKADKPGKCPKCGMDLVPVKDAK